MASPVVEAPAKLPLAPEVPYAPPVSEIKEEVLFGFYLRIIRRFAWHIFAVVAVLTILVALYGFSLPKVYESVAVVRVDTSGVPRVGSALRESAAPDPNLLVDTERQVLTSPAVLSQAIEALHLGQIAEFARKVNPQEPANQQLAQLVREVQSHITITRPLNTLLLEIHFRSQSPELSASAANGIAQAFLNQEYTTRGEALVDSSRSMSKQLDALRATMEQDQQALVQYENESNVLDPDSKENIAESALGQASENLSKAEADLVQAQAERDLAESANIDALMTTPYGTQLAPLRERLAKDRAALARIAEVDGPQHPLLRQQQQIVQSDQAAIAAEGRQLASEVMAHYAGTALRARLAEALVEQKRAELEQYDRKAIRYRNLKTASDNSTHLYYELQQQIQDSNVASNLRGEELRVINPAQPNYRPVGPRVLLMTLLTALLATGVCIGAAIGVGFLDKTIATAEQMEHWFQLGVIGTLPQIDTRNAQQALDLSGYGEGGLVPVGGRAESRPSAFREMILSLHSAILFAAPEGMVTLAVSSALPGEGKSTVSSHLAAVLAGHGHQVVLIDADMRKPKVHRLFNLPNRVGLSSVLMGSCDVAQALLPIPSLPGLSVLPAGASPQSPATLLQLHFPGLLERLRCQARFIVVDCPPVLGFADAATVANCCDGAVLVVRAGQTERGYISGAVRQLRGVRANLFGTVLNQVSTKVDGYYSYHSYYGNYYEPGEKGEDE